MAELLEAAAPEREVQEVLRIRFASAGFVAICDPCLEKECESMAQGLEDLAHSIERGERGAADN